MDWGRIFSKIVSGFLAVYNDVNVYFFLVMSTGARSLLYSDCSGGHEGLASYF